MRLSLRQLASEAADARLLRALTAHDEQQVGAPDLVALVRAEAVRRGYASIVVPHGTGWPTAHDWGSAHFTRATADSTAPEWAVTAQPWLPTWADNGVSPELAAANRGFRQPSQAVPGDPFLPRVSGGSEHYRTPAQREAIRAVLASQPGETVLAVLPTGTGKTLVATAAAFLAKPRMTLLVVPTVSLALDLERRLTEDYDLHGPIAYHAGLREEEKEALRTRLRGREQWIVVTSPEATITSLAPTLEALATEGNLGYFVIDEAHIVASWGGAFRPAFQALAGLRRRLKSLATGAHADFTTVLLTGTLDDHGLRLLEHFFAEGELTLVAAQATRPEPAYWSIRCTDEDKRQCLVEVIRHLPRPLIVYTSLVTGEQAVNTRDVIRWLRDAGFSRVAAVTGTSNTSERQAAISALRCEGSVRDDRDIVVASSAFGLGVDIADIRAVVHVCVPESLDRFYQEVGRGGRDGNASVSLLIHSPADRQVAQRLSAQDNIGPDKAWLRWRAMHDGSATVHGRLSVSLTAAHHAVVAPSSDANLSWNLHTLTMMELAGMVRLHWSPPLAVPKTESDADIEAFYEAHFKRVQIDVLHGDLDDEELFKSRFVQARQRSGGAAVASLAKLETLVDHLQTCHNALFAHAYTLHPSTGDVAHVDVRCGGCPVCRSTGKLPWSGGTRLPSPYLSRSHRAKPAQLLPLLGIGNSCSITYIGTLAASWDELEPLIRRLVDGGIRLLVVPVDGRRIVERMTQRAGVAWFAAEMLGSWLDRDWPSPLASVVVLPPDAGEVALQRILQARNEVDALVIIHEHHQRGPRRSKALLRELLRPSVDLATALGRI